jgi:putative tryptophan/tyrosine transport system substrate-binding protein
MKRREFISIIGGVAAWPLAARAQQVVGVPKVGLLYPGSAALAERRIPALRDGMSDAGFAGPDQVLLLVRAANGDPAKIVPLTAELIANKVDVLFAISGAAIQAARFAATSIPIVGFDLESDPIESGWIESFAHPGGNVTGIFLDFPDFGMKWLELLKEISPGLANVVALWDPATSTIQAKAIAAAAERLRVRVDVLEIKTPAEFNAAFAAIGARNPDGLVFLNSPLFGTNPKQLADLTLKYQVPSVCSFSEISHAGGLLSYGPSLDAIYREQGVMIGKVLHGAKPADLPAERPDRFQLVVNAKTAKALNLTIPTSVLLRADEVIE